ncbi:MAG: hypothetical protein H6748_07200 [Spirochaetaceae bacterium]|nr:hypothetical protein [Spirochaetaceae bacterium]
MSETLPEVRFERDRVLADARRRAGLEDFGADDFSIRSRDCSTRSSTRRRCIRSVA